MSPAGGASSEAAPGERGRALVVAAALIGSLAVLVTYVALGGGSYEPAEARDPCTEREVEWPEGIEAAAEQVALSALDGAACDLQVTREALLLALADAERRQDFLDERHISPERLEAAVRAGLDRAVDDAVAAGAIGGVEAFLLREAIERAPLDLIIDLAQSENVHDALGLLGGLAD